MKYDITEMSGTARGIREHQPCAGRWLDDGGAIRSSTPLQNIDVSTRSGLDCVFLGVREMIMVNVLWHDM